MTIHDVWKNLLVRFRRRAAAPTTPELETPASEEVKPFYWCPIASVVETRPFGPKGAETRRGTKHFRPGAKVYYVDAYWGMGAETVTVVGHHRRSRRLITLSMRASHLTNWRVGRTYSPHIIGELAKRPLFGRLGPNSEEGKKKAEEIVAYLAAPLEHPHYGPGV